MGTRKKRRDVAKERFWREVGEEREIGSAVLPRRRCEGAGLLLMAAGVGPV